MVQVRFRTTSTALLVVSNEHGLLEHSKSRLNPLRLSNSKSSDVDVQDMLGGLAAVVDALIVLTSA